MALGFATMWRRSSSSTASAAGETMRSLKPDALLAILVFAIAKEDAPLVRAIVGRLMTITGARRA